MKYTDSVYLTFPQSCTSQFITQCHVVLITASHDLFVCVHYSCHYEIALSLLQYTTKHTDFTLSFIFLKGMCPTEHPVILESEIDKRPDKLMQISVVVRIYNPGEYKFTEIRVLC